MKRIIFANILLILFATFTSCSKEKQTLRDNTWIVESMKVHADADLQYPSNFIITLSFPRIGEYEFRGVNRCLGKVKFRTNNGIEFKVAECTRLDGDVFSADCYLLLNTDINNYTVNDNKLILKGNEGKIINFIKQ